ncbi:copia protein [Tanacetum coccineum]
MTTLAKHIIIAGAENRPPMLEKSMYDSWASRIRLLIKGKKHGRMMLDSIDNDPLVYQTVEENGQTRPKKYSELTEAQQLQDDCDVQATNIILHGLPPDVYALVNHQEAAKDIWDRVKMLMKGTELSYQERECKLYNLFDKFAHVSEWIKFVTDVNLAKSLYTTNYDQFYSMYPPPQQFTSVYAAPIHHPHHHTPVNPVNPQQHPVSPSPFISPLMTPQSQDEFSQLDSGLVVPMFQQGEDPIECINKAMAFLSTSYAGTGNRGIATTLKRNIIVGPPRVVKCYNCQGEGHMGRQCTQPKRPNHLDAYDSDCDDLSSAKAVLMANLSSCDPEVLSKVPYFESYPNDMINQDVQEMQYSEQTRVDDFEDNEIHSGSNIIPYSQYLQETEDAVIQDTNPSAPNDLLVLSLVEQMTDHVAHLDKENQTNKMSNEKESKYIDKEIVLEKQNKELENIIYIDLEEESRSKMLDKQNYPISIEKKIKISPIDYSTLNKIKEDFGKRFVTQKELSAEQAFWLKHSSFSETPVTSHTPVRYEAHSELPKVSLVNESLKKLKYQLANFDKVVKKRTTSDAITAGAWGFEHTKACFVTEIMHLIKLFYMKLLKFKLFLTKWKRLLISVL